MAGVSRVSARVAGWLPRRLRSGLRWVLVGPVCYAGLLGGAVLTVVLHDLADRQCPVDKLVSGFCIAWWSSLAHQAATAIGAMVAAALVVGLPWGVAPRFKTVVAGVAFAFGFTLVAWMTAFGDRNPVMFVAATTSGLAAVVLARVKALTP